jgi:hypothetical protein
MATGIKITKATYGVGSTTVDVKAAVSSNIKEGELNLVVSPDSLGVEDPAPGQTKQVTVSYTINGGDTNTKTAYDNEAIIISAPPARVASGLDIKKAEYGYPGNMTDVTDAIRNYIKDGLIKLKVSPSALGIPDPNPNKQKVLEIDYTLNGAKNSESVKDNSTFSVSAPPADRNADDDPSLGTQIGWAVAYALMYSAYFVGIVAAFKYGELIYKGVGYVFGAISVIPFGFFGVCFFAMVYPFLSGSKVDIMPPAAVIENVIKPLTPSVPSITQ